MPQLTRITFQSAEVRYFRWPYQAKVMKMFEMVSRTMVRMFFRSRFACNVLLVRRGIMGSGYNLSYRIVWSYDSATVVVAYPSAAQPDSKRSVQPCELLPNP